MSHFCHFWAFWPLSLMKRLLDGHLPWQFGFKSCPLWPLLAVCHLSSLGDTLFCSMVDFSSMFHGGLSSTVVVSHGDLSSIYGGWSGNLGGHHSSLSAGCWAVCSWGRISASPPPSFLKRNLRHLLVPCVTIHFPCLDPVIEGLEMNSASSTFNVMGSWKESNFYSLLSQTYPGSWNESVYLSFWPNLYLGCVLGSWKESTFVSVALYRLVYHWLGSWNDVPWYTFHRLTHISLIWRVLKGVSKICSWVLCVAASSQLSLFSVVHDPKWLSFPQLYVCNGLEMGSWKELILCSLCPFWYEGLEMGSWK